MANVTNAYLYSTTNTGASLSTSVDYLPNIVGQITLGLGVNQVGVPYFVPMDFNATVGYFRDGLALSDFNDSNIGYIAIPFYGNYLNNGTLLGAMSSYLGGLGAGAAEWDSASAWAVGDFANYYDGHDVTVYECIHDVPIGSPAPPNDTANWSFYQKAFYLRIVPAEDALQPGLQNGDRFYHYVKCYPKLISIGSPDFQLLVAAKSYTTWAANSYGSQNAIYTDNSPNANVTLGVSSASVTISGSTVTATYSNTNFPRFVVGKKVRIRVGASLQTFFSATVTALNGNTGFTATISSTGAFSNTTAYTNYDFVTYASGIYYVSNAVNSPPVGTLPTNGTYWTNLAGTFNTAAIDPIIDGWNVYLDTDFFEQELMPIPAGTTSYSNAHARNEVNSYAYNDQIVNQKQTLFSTGDYIIHEGFPFDKNSITGGSINITAGILPTAISSISRPPVTTTDSGSLPQSDNRWIPQSVFSSFAYPANTNYTWSSNNGATTRTLTVFNDANHTYLPDSLNGNAASNPSNNANLLKLATPDASIPPLTAINSVAFKTNDLMFQSAYNPYKINSPTSNDFTTFMVLYLDYVPSAVMNSQLTADETNWYGIMSQATQTNVLATDIANWNAYTQFAPRLSVRYKLDGTVTLNLGDSVLTAIRTRSGVNRPFQPLIIGLTINAADTSATLTVVDTEVHRSTVTYTKNWGVATPVIPNTMLYGAVPYANQLHSSKMYVLEINHYYSSHDNAFFDNEIKTMDKMYAVTSGRVS